MGLFDKKKDKKNKKVEVVEAPLVAIDPTVAALEAMKPLIDQVNVLYGSPNWPKSYRLWWDFDVKPPRLILTKWNRATDEVVYPTPDMGTLRR